MVKTTASTHCTYPRKDGQAEPLVKYEDGIPTYGHPS